MAWQDFLRNWVFVSPGFASAAEHDDGFIQVVNWRRMERVATALKRYEPSISLKYGQRSIGGGIMRSLMNLGGRGLNL